MDKKRKQKNLLIGGLCAIVLVMAVGYAAFATSLNITGTAETTNDWGVRINSITPDKTVTNTGTEANPVYASAGSISASKVDDLSATFSAALVQPGDSVVYDIVIENYGDLDAKLQSITMPNSNNPAITFTKTGIKEGNKLASKATTSLKITVTYNSNVKDQPASTTGSFTVTLNFVQDDGTGTAITGGNTLAIDPTFIPQYYRYGTDTVTIGSSYDTSTWVQDPSELERDYYLGHDVDSTTGNVTANYACFILNNTQYCMRGKDGSSGTNYWTQNKALLGTLQDATPPAITCTTFSDSYANCSGGGLGYLNASSNGRAYSGVASSVYCRANNNGYSNCNE